MPVYIYDRLDEPTRAVLEAKLAAAHQTLSGCTYSLMTNWLPRFHVSHTFVHLTDPDALIANVEPSGMLQYARS